MNTAHAQQLTASEYLEMKHQKEFFGVIILAFACIGLFVVCRQLIKLINWLLFR